MFCHCQKTWKLEELQLFQWEAVAWASHSSQTRKQVRLKLETDKIFKVNPNWPTLVSYAPSLKVSIISLNTISWGCYFKEIEACGWYGPKPKKFQISGSKNSIILLLYMLLPVWVLWHVWNQSSCWESFTIISSSVSLRPGVLFSPPVHWDAFLLFV